MSQALSVPQLTSMVRQILPTRCKATWGILQFRTKEIDTLGESSIGIYGVPESHNNNNSQ
jgi:hypothetical protein